MSSSESVKRGCAFICNTGGQVTRVVDDQLHLMPSGEESRFLITELTGDYNVAKTLNFFNSITSGEVSLNWEIYIQNRSDFEVRYFSGIQCGNDIVILAVTHPEDSGPYYWQLLESVLDQPDLAHLFVKAKPLLQSSTTTTPETIDYFTEISRLNNELTDIQRSLAKKSAELERLIEIKNEMIGVAAHDLRNPLASIIGFCQLLLSDSEDNRNLSEYQLTFLENIHSSSKYMLSLVEDILEFSRIDSGNITLKKSTFDLVPFIRRIVDLNQHIAKNKDITLHLNQNPESITIHADSTKLEQVVNNLISNAIKFSHPGDEVEIDANQDSQNSVITLSVTDHGVGIPKADQKRLFQAFYKTSAKPTGGESGTGLGLAISYRIITAHDGDITIDSSKGKGTTFNITLPDHVSEVENSQPASHKDFSSK